MVWYFFCTFAYTMIKGISRFLDFFRIKLDIMPKNDYTIQVHREVEQLAARWAHNPKVAGSSPAFATKVLETREKSVFSCLYFYVLTIYFFVVEK